MGAGLSQVPKVVGKADELVGQGIGKIKEAGAPLAEKAISAMPPAAVNIIEEKEKREPPQSIGI